MDPITLITTAAVAGAGMIGTSVLDKSVELLWERFKAKLNIGDIQGSDPQTSTAVSPLSNENSIKEAIILTGAVNDPEIISMAAQLNTELKKAAPVQFQQIADKIINIQNNYGTINM